jgi:hypothetical protein
MGLRVMSVVENAGRNKSFWGLVEQKGPWKETATDRRHKSSPYGVGRGTPIRGRGGTVHAGHGDFDSLTVPANLTGRKPPPKMSVLAQRSVVYKPLVYGGPRGIAGRMRYYSRYLKGLGDRSGKGVDQGTQTSGNDTGVGGPAVQNLSEIEGGVTRQRSGRQLPMLPGQLETHEVNPVLGSINRAILGNESGSHYSTGTFGSAVDMTPHPGTEVIPGESVGQILGKASGRAAKLAAITRAIPVVGDVTTAGAAGLGVAAGVVGGVEALGEGDVPGAITQGKKAIRQAQKLKTISGVNDHSALDAVANGLSTGDALSRRDYVGALMHGRAAMRDAQHFASFNSSGESVAGGETVTFLPIASGVGVATEPAFHPPRTSLVDQAKSTSKVSLESELRREMANPIKRSLEYELRREMANPIKRSLEDELRREMAKK